MNRNDIKGVYVVKVRSGKDIIYVEVPRRLYDEALKEKKRCETLNGWIRFLKNHYNHFDILVKYVEHKINRRIVQWEGFERVHTDLESISVNT